jgi:hypothetical protein
MSSRNHPSWSPLKGRKTASSNSCGDGRWMGVPKKVTIKNNKKPSKNKINI